VPLLCLAGSVTYILLSADVGLLVCWLPATCKQGVVNAIDSRSYDLDVSKDAVRSFFISAVLNSDLNPLRDRSGQN